MLGAALAGRALPAADNVGGACRLPLVPLREANAKVRGGQGLCVPWESTCPSAEACPN